MQILTFTIDRFGNRNPMIGGYTLPKFTLPETNIAHENPIFPGKYHQNGGFSMATVSLQECNNNIALKSYLKHPPNRKPDVFFVVPPWTSGTRCFKRWWSSSTSRKSYLLEELKFAETPETILKQIEAGNVSKKAFWWMFFSCIYIYIWIYNLKLIVDPRWPLLKVIRLKIDGLTKMDLKIKARFPTWDF